MESKKNESLDLEGKRPLFFNIGLVVSLTLVIVAFNWKGEFEGLDLQPREDVFEPTFEMPRTKISEPEPPKPEAPKPKPSNQPPVFVESEVVEELVKELTLDMEEEPEEMAIPGLSEDIPEDVADETLVFAEKMPSFPGGMEAFYKYVSHNIDYPATARRMGLTGKVFVQFVIDKDGKIIEVEAVKGMGAGCDEAAVEVLKNSPKWNPGKQRGRAVRVRMVLPITFKLG